MKGDAIHGVEERKPARVGIPPRERSVHGQRVVPVGKFHAVEQLALQICPTPNFLVSVVQLAVFAAVFAGSRFFFGAPMPTSDADFAATTMPTSTMPTSPVPSEFDERSFPWSWNAQQIEKDVGIPPPHPSTRRARYCPTLCCWSSLRR